MIYNALNNPTISITPPVVMDQCGEANAVTKLAVLSLQDRSLLTAKVSVSVSVRGYITIFIS